MKRIVFILLASIVGFSCDNSSDDDNEKLCSKEFRSIDLTIQYEDATPVALDSFKVYWDNTDVTAKYTDDDYQRAQETGSYTVVNDNLKNELKGLQETFWFNGFIDNELVVEKHIAVKADDCHVYYNDSEPLSITITGEPIVFCTEELRTFGIQILYEDETPVVLDSCKVMYQEYDITPSKSSQDLYWKFFKYALTDDGLNKYFIGEDSVLFTGYIGGNEVVKEYFLFKTDRCHASYIGEKPLIVTLKK